MIELIDAKTKEQKETLEVPSLEMFLVNHFVLNCINFPKKTIWKRLIGEYVSREQLIKNNIFLQLVIISGHMLYRTTLNTTGPRGIRPCNDLIKFSGSRDHRERREYKCAPTIL